MPKAVVVVLADCEGHENLGRVVNALTIAKEFKEAGDEVAIVFDGAGTRWVPELSSRDHRAHPLFQSVRDVVAGVCGYCADAFGAREGVESTGVRVLEEYDRHPSIRSYVVRDFEVITV